MHFLMLLIALMNKGIEAIHSLPRLKARAKREQGYVTREAIKLRKADQVATKAWLAYQRADEKRRSQARVVAEAEWTAKQHHDAVHEAELAIAKAVARAVNNDALPAYDCVDVVLDKLKLDRIESMLVEAKVAFAKQSVKDWQEQVDLFTEELSNAPEGNLADIANANLCNAIRRMGASEEVLGNMRQERDDYHQWLERRRMEKEEARLFRKTKKWDLR
jgi:hypothetical protein